MALTSGILLALSALIYIALFALLVIKWEEIRGVFLRALSVILVNLLLILSLGLWLNNSFGFYSSWKELFGISDQPKVALKASAIDLSKATITSNGSAVIEEKFTGETSKITSSVWFLIPKSIVNSIQNNSVEKFPVAIFMSGSPGVPTAWINGLKLDNQIQSVKSQMAIKDFISVMPDFNIRPHTDTGCMNIPDGVQVEDWLTKDVYQYVVKNLPANRSDWVITGYSTGGWCTAMLAMKHPEIFKAAAPIAGFYKPEPPFSLTAPQRLYLKKEYDLLSLSRSRGKALDLFMITSKQDSSSYSSTNWFYNRLGSSHNVELLTLQSGGHNFTTWRPIVQDILKWFAEEIK